MEKFVAKFGHQFEESMLGGPGRTGPKIRRTKYLVLWFKKELIHDLGGILKYIYTA